MKPLYKTTLALLAAAGGLLMSSSAFAASGAVLDINNVPSTAATRLDKVALLDTQALPVVPAAIAPYCVNTYTTGVEPLTLVKINDINNPSAAATGGTQHEDFTSIVGTLRPGATYAVTMKANTDGGFAHGFALYVDWNQDGLLTGANEGYWVGTVTGSTGTDALSATTYITVPAGAVLGNTRLRAMTAYNTTALTGLLPCRTGAGYGQSEDYTVTIDPAAVVPTLPLSLTASFTPTLGAVPASTALAIAVANINAAPTPITADFTTTLPAGMTLAADATTTCPGTFTGASGGNTITLASGASIPSGGCAISANVTVTAGGNYAVTAGPLTTAEGSASAVAKFFGWNSTPSTSYNTGFEAPDFTVGAINSQQGWSARTSNVATTTPANGAQHFSQTGLASPTTSNNPLAISPDFPVGSTRYVAVSANLRISRTTNGASWQFQPQDPDAGLLSTIVRFNRTGNAIETFSWAGGSGTAVSTGATFTANTYFNFKLLVDRATSNVRLCKDGVQIFESTDGTGTTGGNNVASMVFQQATGSGQTANNTFFADDLNVSYTPSYNCDGSMPAHTVTPSVGTPSGTITPDTDQTVDENDTIDFTLAADAGFHIDNVGGTCGGTLAGSVFTTAAITGDCTVIANFAADTVTYTVTPSVGTPSGTITPDTDQTVDENDTIDFTLAADAGFHIDNVGGTCGGSLAGSVFTTAAVTTDCTVIANFAADNDDLVCAAPNHNMVATFDGSSINWITGVIDDVGGQNGWNPYASAGNVSFYWPGAGGGGGVATGNVYSVLAPGAVIGPSSTFIALTATAATAVWRAGADGYMGFKLTCPGAGTCYGYAHLTSTAATGFPLTLVDYCYDSAGARIIIPGGAATHTVTPSVGTPSGTITPDTDQTVNNGDTIDFTLAADAGFEIDNVGGSCGGTLDSVSGIFTTALVTADCTVIANFAAIPPRIDVIPASLAASQVADQTSTQILTIANVGSGTLNWNIDEEETAAPRAVAPFRLAPPVPVVTSSSDCPQYEKYAGREPDGWAEFCGTPAQASPGLVNRAPADTAFALDVRNDRFVQFALNNFPGQTLVGTQPDAMYGVDFDPTATTLYALNDVTGELGTINLTTGAFTGIVACTDPDDGGWSGLSIDPVSGTFYASTATDLYVLNPATCSPALIGAFGTGGIMIDIAVNTAGQMYGHDIGTDSIYSINTATGAASLVGPTGYAANFAQGMDFDNTDGTLYIFVYTGAGTNTFGTVNLATGAVTPLAQDSPLGEFEGATQTVGTTPPCSVSLDIPWLSLDTLAGSNAGGTWTDVTVTFDSTGYGVGVYKGNLCVSSNDTTQPLVPVPVTMTVEAPPSTAIFCSSFEEGEDGTCATAP